MDLNTNVLLALAFCLLVIISLMCKSSFGNLSKTAPPPSPGSPPPPDGSVMIFYAPWCGHCKNSMGEFNKARESSGGKVIMINSDDPGSKDTLTKYKVAGFPTIVKTDGTVYKGPRTSESILAFAKS